MSCTSPSKFRRVPIILYINFHEGFRLSRTIWGLQGQYCPKIFTSDMTARSWPIYIPADVKIFNTVACEEYKKRSGTVIIDDNHVYLLHHCLVATTSYMDDTYKCARYSTSSSSSSPETSAFSCPAFAISCARSCSSVSDTALGWWKTYRVSASPSKPWIWQDTPSFWQ